MKNTVRSMIKQTLSFILPIFTLLMINCVQAVEAQKTNERIVIDGVANEKSWQGIPWSKLDHHILGTVPSKDDFQGRFKLLWDDNTLYLLTEIVDDVLFDQHANPLDSYWDDDCLEVFIDEDHSGGEHQFNFNAFAYHIALDNQVVDIGANNLDGSTNFILLNDHINSKWQRSEQAPHNVIWELAIKVYDDSYTHPNLDGKHQPVKLRENKVLGFMLAYCDNDGSKNREHFYGSTAIIPVQGDKNLGYKNASVFEALILR